MLSPRVLCVFAFALASCLYMAWRDDRQREGIFRADDRYWWPRPELVNWHAGGTRGGYLCSFSTGAPTFTGLNISDGRWAFCQARHQAALDADILLHDFPFDRQRAEIESFLWSVSKLRFVALPTLQMGLADPRCAAGSPCNQPCRCMPALSVAAQAGAVPPRLPRGGTCVCC